MDYSLIINLQILKASENVHFHTHTRKSICNSRDKQTLANFVTTGKFIFASRLSYGNRLCLRS